MDPQPRWCNFANKTGPVYVDSPLQAAADKGTAMSYMASSLCSCILLALPAGVSLASNGMGSPTTIILVLMMLSLSSSIAKNYMQMEDIPSGYRTDCIKRPMHTVIQLGPSAAF